MKAKVIAILMLFQVMLVNASPLEDYKSAYEKGWQTAYKVEKIENIPPVPEVIYVAHIDENMSIKEQGFLDGLNTAGYRILMEKWNSYGWWQKLIHFETWFLLFIIL